MICRRAVAAAVVFEPCARTRFRLMIPVFPTLVHGVPIDLAGVPASGVPVLLGLYALTGNERTVMVEHVAQVPPRSRCGIRRWSSRLLQLRLQAVYSRGP